MNLYAAESVNNDTTIGGFVVEFDSGIRKVIAWRQDAPILPPLDAAKEFVAKLVDTLLRERRLDEVETTNWASAVAAVQKIIVDWNERQKQRRFTNDLADLAKIEQRVAQEAEALRLPTPPGVH